VLKFAGCSSILRKSQLVNYIQQRMENRYNTSGNSAIVPSKQ